MTFVEKNNIRLQSITRASGIDDDGTLLTTKLPTKDGLGIEYCYDGEHYIVISFIKYEPKEDGAYLDLVGNRILELNKDDFDDFKQIANIGIDMVNCVNEENE